MNTYIDFLYKNVLTTFVLASMLLVACGEKANPITPVQAFSTTALPTPETMQGSPSPIVDTHTVTPVPQTDMSFVKLTSSDAIDANWSLDSRILTYSIGYDSYATYDIESQSILTFTPTLNIPIEVWEKIGKDRSRVFNRYFWYSTAISPNADKILYTSEIVKQNGMATEPSAYWLSSLSEGTSIKLGDADGPCYYSVFPITLWFKDNQRLFFYCYYEGPASLYYLDLNTPSITDTGLAISDTSSRIALSTSEMLLAFVDSGEVLQILDIDSGQTTPVIYGGLQPSWGKDDRYLYYLVSSDISDCGNPAIHRFDLETKTAKLLFKTPLMTSDGLPINVLCSAPFLVSPNEEYLVFSSSSYRGLWLWKGFLPN